MLRRFLDEIHRFVHSVISPDGKVLGVMQVLADGTMILPDGTRVLPGGALPFDKSWSAEEAYANGFVKMYNDIVLYQERNIAMMLKASCTDTIRMGRVELTMRGLKCRRFVQLPINHPIRCHCLGSWRSWRMEQGSWLTGPAFFLTEHAY